MLQSAINAGLGGNYRLRGGMATHNGQVVAYYQALSGDKVKLVIIGQAKGRVQQVEIIDQNVVTVWAASLARRLAKCTARRSVPVNLLPTKTLARWRV